MPLLQLGFYHEPTSAESDLFQLQHEKHRCQATNKAQLQVKGIAIGEWFMILEIVTLLVCQAESRLATVAHQKRFRLQHLQIRNLVVGQFAWDQMESIYYTYIYRERER